MAQPVCRLGDLSVGHSIYPPRPNVAGSPKTFVDALPVHRVGDAWAPHPVNPHPGPPQTTISGSPKMFADMLPVARVGDSISCGDTIATGSGKTFAG